MPFFFAAIAFLFLGRKIGWFVSRAFLYPASLWMGTILSIGWGIGVAITVHGMISWGHPGVIMRWILGYALGAYVSIPNFGLVDDNSVPSHAQLQHMIISNLPLIVYIIGSIVFAFTFPKT
jgi:hypothetical protein